MAGKLPNPHVTGHVAGHGLGSMDKDREIGDTREMEEAKKISVAYKIHLVLKPYYPVLPRIFILTGLLLLLFFWRIFEEF
jgi:hypothetical protein